VPCAVERDVRSGRGSIRASAGARPPTKKRIISNNSYAHDDQGDNPGQENRGSDGVLYKLWPFVSDVAIFVLKRDVKLQLTICVMTWIIGIVASVVSLDSFVFLFSWGVVCLAVAVLWRTCRQVSDISQVYKNWWRMPSSWNSRYTTRPFAGVGTAQHLLLFVTLLVCLLDCLGLCHCLPFCLCFLFCYCCW